MAVVNLIVLCIMYVRTKYAAFATYLTIMHRFSARLQIFAAARNASKRSASADEASVTGL